MNKETMTKLTIKDLIAKKEQVLNNKKKTRCLYIRSLDGIIMIEKPSVETVIDASKIDSGLESDKYLVYNCIVEPNLHDKELQQVYGCVEPSDILRIFEDGEISSIASECMKLAGYTGSVTVVDDIKN